MPATRNGRANRWGKNGAIAAETSGEVGQGCRDRYRAGELQGKRAMVARRSRGSGAGGDVREGNYPKQWGLV